MSNYELCINLGSNFTTIYKKNSGIVLREPSVVLIDTTNKNFKVINFGLDANKESGKLATNQVLVKPIIEGVIKNFELTKKMVIYFLNKIVKYSLIKPYIKLIVCLPVALKSEQYEIYKNLFYSIGFAKIKFVYNSVCASLKENPYFCLGKANLLVDIGAGKTEICSVVNNKIISACSLNVGGELIDKKIAEYLLKTKNCVISQSIAENIKREIGSLYETDKSSIEVLVQDLNSQTPLNTIFTAKDISVPIYESYFKILQTIQVFINNSSPEVAADIKNDGIILYGGASLITGLEKFFKKVLKISVFVMDEPEVFAIKGSGKLFSDSNLLEKICEEN